MQNMRIFNYITNILHAIESDLSAPINFAPFCAQYKLSEPFLRERFLHLVHETPEDYRHRLNLEAIVYRALEQGVFNKL